MAAKLYIEEEGYLEDSLELNSIRSLVLESIKSNRYSRISFSLDLDTFNVQLNEMLESVSTASDRVQELMSFCKWSLEGTFAHSLVETTQPNPEYVHEQLVEIKILIKEGLSNVEKLYQSSNDFFQMIGGLLLLDVNLPDLPDFEVPQSSFPESLSRLLNEVEVTRMVVSKDLVQFLINCVSHHILTYRRYRARMRRIINTYFSHPVFSELAVIGEDVQYCLDKVADFGLALEREEVYKKLKSANTWLEYAFDKNSPPALASLKSLFQTYNQFRTSFESFINEDYNIGKSKEELFQDMKSHSISTGLITPIVSSLKCSSETAWYILKNLHSMYNGQGSIQCEERIYQLSISSDNELD